MAKHKGSSDYNIKGQVPQGFWLGRAGGVTWTAVHPLNRLCLQLIAPRLQQASETLQSFLMKNMLSAGGINVGDRLDRKLKTEATTKAGTKDGENREDEE